MVYFLFNPAVWTFHIVHHWDILLCSDNRPSIHLLEWVHLPHTAQSHPIQNPDIPLLLWENLLHRPYPVQQARFPHILHRSDLLWASLCHYPDLYYLLLQKKSRKMLYFFFIWRLKSNTGGEDALLAAKNKWLIGHPEGGLPEGSYIGLTGENPDITES